MSRTRGLFMIAWVACLPAGAAAQSAALEAKAAPLIGAPSSAAVRASEPTRAHDDESCVLGALCFGPVVTLGAVDPLGVGAHLRYGPYLGAAIDYQFLPTRIDLGAASATWSLFTVEGRVHPFGNVFFLSAGFGLQSFSARVRNMTPIGEITMTGSLAMPALKLGIGLVGREGFVLGADIGFNFLRGAPEVEFGTPSGPGASYRTGPLGLQQEVNDIARQAVQEFPVIPQVNLIRMGYLF